MDTTTYLSSSPLDSARFGITVERATLPAGTPTEAAVAQIRGSAADLVILRVPAGEPAVPTALQMQGEVVIHADTLVYHGVSLRDVPGTAAPNVRLATTGDLPAIRDIAAQGFRNYRAHYAANPLLPAEDVLAGYIQWAQSRVASASGGSCTWVVTDDGQPAGFATCDVADGTVEIVLNAVHPAFERRGHYGTLLSHLMQHYACQGLDKLIISTQVWNYTVQRQWGRAGLLLSAAYDTYHIDRRMAHSRETP